MTALVIFDTAFGNTQQIAEAMAAALRAPCQNVSAVDPASLTQLDLLIVGSPTQAFTALPTLKNFLAAIPANALRGTAVAAFDTRIEFETMEQPALRFVAKTFMQHYAGKPIADALVAKGGHLAADPAGFYVLDREGPLKPGELDRAAHWATALAPVRQL